MPLSYKLVRKLFKYDDGNLIWKVSKGSVKAGSIAGCITFNGRFCVKINEKQYLIHRVVWLYHYGYMPENFLDHIDRNPLNNRIENLREASKSCNAINCDLHSNNTSGIKGISFYKSLNKWKVTITSNKKQHYLGIFKNFDEAVCYRLAAEQCFGWDNCNSNSSAYKYIQTTIQKQ